MNRTLFRALMWLPWLALPMTALRFWGAWDQLPVRVATHFDAHWRPNGWMTREAALETALGITAVVLVVFTVILFLAQKQKAADAFAWAWLAFTYVIIGFVYEANDHVVTYNLTGQSAALNFWILLLPPAMILLTAIYVHSQRSAPLPPSVSLAEEQHSSPLWGTVIAIAGAGAFVGTFPADGPAIHMFGVTTFAILLLCGVAAWSGFHYSFTSHGLEIRTLGFRLRSIPADQIQKYAVGSWNLMRGYGIRGLGDFRAYVWGNRGVQVSTSQGTVFLGHNEPERIMRDLEMIAPRGAPVGSR